MKLWLFTLTLAGASVLPLRAADLIDPARLYTWTPGVTIGVPSGIDRFRAGGANQRTNLIDVTQSPHNADNTGASDAVTAINSAISAAASNDVVYFPAGTYRVNSSINIAYKDHITLRGASRATTTIKGYVAGGAVLNVGGDANYLWNDPLTAPTNSPVAGATNIGFADTSVFTVGQLALLMRQQNLNATNRVVDVKGFGHSQRHMVRITAVTASNITIWPPLAFALPSTDSPVVALAGVQADYVGIENLTVNGTNSTTSTPLILMQQTYACWAYDVEAVYAENYHFGVWYSSNCEIRKSIGHRRKSEGSNGGALLGVAMGGCLIEDNIFGENFPVLELNGGCTANVFAFNYIYDSKVFGSPGAAIDSNHGAHNSFNLYEGNISPNLQCDGYFGSASEDTLLRNWFHGLNSSTDTSIRGLCVNLHRFTRKYNVVGNILGTDSFTSYIHAGHASEASSEWGMPNMGNYSWTGTAQPTTGDWWSHIPNGERPNHRGVFSGATAYTHSGTVKDSADQSGLTYIVNNAAKNGLTTWTTPPSSDWVEIGAGGWQELDLDVEATLLLKANYNTEDNQIPAAESTGDTVPTSLFRTSKPTYFPDAMTWPPFDSSSVGWGLTTNTLYTLASSRTPAHYAYLNNGVWPADGSGGGGGTTTTLNIGTLRIGGP